MWLVDLFVLDRSWIKLKHIFTDRTTSVSPWINIETAAGRVGVVDSQVDGPLQGGRFSGPANVFASELIWAAARPAGGRATGLHDWHLYLLDSKLLQIKDWKADEFTEEQKREEKNTEHSTVRLLCCSSSGWKQRGTFDFLSSDTCWSQKVKRSVFIKIK